MNCDHIREELVGVAAGDGVATPEIEKHLGECSGCADVLAGLRSTMAMMDEWQAPEPSPYFDVRFQARLREEKARESRSWFEWLRKPVIAAVAALLVAAGVGLFEGGRNPVVNTLKSITPTKIVAQRGTAVGDLQYLDRHAEMLNDFDALDDLDTQQ